MPPPMRPVLVPPLVDDDVMSMASSSPRLMARYASSAVLYACGGNASFLPFASSVPATLRRA